MSTFKSMAAPSQEVSRLYAEIRKLSPPDQLRIASDLLEKQRPKTAMLIAQGVAHDLETLHLQGKF